MSDFEKPPSAWGWNPDISQPDLDTKLTSENARLVSLAVRTVNPLRFAAVWEKKNASEANAGWTPDTDEQNLRTILNNKSARLVCLAPYMEGTTLHLAAAWVPNSGADATKSDFTSNMDWATLTDAVADASARPIILRSYVRDGQRRHAAIWIDNTGANKLSWNWNPDVQADALDEMMTDDNGRITCLDPYYESGVLKMGAVWLTNTPTAWWWFYGVDQTFFAHHLDLFCSYMAELQCYADASGVNIAGAIYGFPQPDPQGAQLVDVSGTAQIVSQSNSAAPRDQTQSLSLTLKNLTSSQVTVTAGSVMLCESGGWVGENPPLLGTGGLISTPTLQLAANATSSPSSNYGWGMGPSNFVVDVRAEGGGKQQHTHTVVPIANTGFPAPPPFAAPTPVFFGLMRNPAEVFPLWLNPETLWISVLGQIINTTQSTVRLAAWHLTLEFNGTAVVDKDLDLKLWSWPSGGGPTNVTVGADGAAYLTDVRTFFAFGFQLKNVASDFTGGKLTIGANYKATGQCGYCGYESPIKFVKPVHIAPPFQALDPQHFWNFGNGPNHDGLDYHEWPGERYCYDITVVDAGGSTHKLNDPASVQDNSNFYAWGKPVVAVKDGIVIGADDTNPENNGYTAVKAAQSTQNYVLLQHPDGTYSGYYHLKQHANAVPQLLPGAPNPNPTKVVAGQKIGEIGNAGGSSEPHLHFGYVIVNGRGQGDNTPVIMDGLKTSAGVAVTAVAPNGQYKL
jgi:hypothetical protein